LRIVGNAVTSPAPSHMIALDDLHQRAADVDGLLHP
jgi:hypothetical protein